uniref:Oxysterol-binding protein n=1 Tax=Cyprinodon variegatus TaxID=28743 RepID=A0A3Q2EJJ1_CYPVA
MEKTQEDLLLLYAAEGNCSLLQKLLLSSIDKNNWLDINYRSRSKSTLGWTALHLACNSGHRDVVKELLKAGVDVNLQNSMGDTPLHIAACIGRKEIVLLLLRYDACSSIINGTAKIPKEVTEDDEIITMLEAAERREMRRREERLLEAAREGDLATLSKLLSAEEAPDVHCKDSLGNTPLHCAAYRGQKHCIIKLLKFGASPNIRNSNSKHLTFLPCSVFGTILLNSYMLAVLLLDFCLLQSSRFLGWRSHWVVIENGTISWYPRQCFDDTVHNFKVPSKMDSIATRKRWLDALDQHASYSTHHFNQDQITANAGSGGDVEMKNLTQAAQACQQKLENEVSIFESMVKNEEHFGKRDINPIQYKYSPAGGEPFISPVAWCLQVWSLKVEQEEEKNKALTEALKTLAAEHNELKQSLSLSSRSSTHCLRSEDDFYDAVSGQQPLYRHLTRQTMAFGQKGNGRRERGKTCNKGHRAYFYFFTSPCFHRTSLPAPMFSRNDVSVWSILKKCIGMELSKIAMPVVLNEPLSFLQRLTEYMEHTYLIHQANAATDSIERMKCVAAFAVSAVASQWERTGKPFNPLLGETYELIRDDLGFRWVSEQVSHHPPISAFHAEGLKEDFLFHGSIYPKLKFWGKSIEAEPKGTITLELPKYNESYTWTNPTCCVHNIIVGQLWIEQYGNVEVINHKTGERCSMTFKPCGLFGKELHKVEGYIQDKSKKKVCAIYGKWTECLYTVDPANFDAHKKMDKKNLEEKKSNKESNVDEESEEKPPPDAETVQVIPGSELIWKIAPRPENSAKFYAFSTFAMQLNELDKNMEEVLPPTDSRLRPDIRAMENGDIDLASTEKKRLEEKQRTAHKNRSKSTEEWKIRWFKQGPNPHNKAQDWLYTKGYWDRNYAQLPDIY